MKRNTILSIIALVAAIAGLTAAVILFLRRKKCELFTEIDEDDFEGLENEDIDFEDVLENQEESEEESDCCADCDACGIGCEQNEIPPEAAEEPLKHSSEESAGE